jgi:gamma-glutamylputrescine oxidase
MSENYIKTYYRDTLHPHKNRPPLDEAVDTQVCVIGGGLAGLSTALGLAEKGKKSILIEANRIGWGASGRNGGFVAKGYAQGYPQLVKKVGLTHTKSLHKLATHGRNLIRQRIEKYNIDCGSLIHGVLGVSWTGQPHKMKDYIRFMREDLGAPLEYRNVKQVRDLCRTEQYYDGFYSPEDFQFHPLNYVHGVATAYEGLGGRIYEGTKALKIEETPAGYTVQTQNGTIKCEQVVVCCSIYIDALNRQLQYAIFPVYTYVMVTKAIPEEVLNQAINTRYAIFDDRYAQDYYRRLPDGRILWGGRVSVKGVPENLAEIMKRDLLKVYPQLEGYIEPDYAWGGTLAYAPHKMPQIGELRPGYWYNTGFGGHGLVPTAVGGDVVSSAIAEGDERYKLFEPFSKLWFAGGALSPYIAQSVYYLWRGQDFLKSWGKDKEKKDK